MTSQTGAVTDFLFGFTGRWLDQDTGLQNNHHRWYDARVGRWLSEDPLSFDAGDTNLYRYSGNDPVGNVDPSGLGFKGVMGAVGSALASGFGALPGTSPMFGLAQTAWNGLTQAIAPQPQIVESTISTDWLAGRCDSNTTSAYAPAFTFAEVPWETPAWLANMYPSAGQVSNPGSSPGGWLSAVGALLDPQTYAAAMGGPALWESQIDSFVRDIAREQLINPWQFATSQPSHLERTVESLLLGNYSQQNPTLARVGIGVGAGLVGADLPMDLRDLSANLVNWEWSWSHAGKTLLNSLALLPVVGMAKYVDDAAAVGKNADELGTVAKNAPTTQMPTLEIDASRYPGLAENIHHAQMAGHPDVLTFGGNVPANRAAALGDVPSIPGFSRDEYPFASTLEGGSASWVGHVSPSEHHAQGGILKNFYQRNNIEPGTRFRVIVRK